MSKSIFGLVLFLLAVTELPLPAQSNEPEFTREELLRVTRFFLSEDKAREAVEALFADQAVSQRAVEGRKESVQQTLPSGSRPLRFGSVGGTTFTDDMLVLLSLLSAETNEKVERYRRQRRGRAGVDAQDEIRWQARRAELSSTDEVKKWLAKDSGAR